MTGVTIDSCTLSGPMILTPGHIQTKRLKDQRGKRQSTTVWTTWQVWTVSQHVASADWFHPLVDSRFPGLTQAKTWPRCWVSSRDDDNQNYLGLLGRRLLGLLKFVSMAWSWSQTRKVFHFESERIKKNCSSELTLRSVLKVSNSIPICRSHKSNSKTNIHTI